MADFDLAIVGGGINGAGIARDAAGRGLRVLLLEQNDLASGTSSASTKLIHGGLRYLEHYSFRLVREALTEREVLLRMAPHIVRPMRFVLPPVPGPRSALLLRLGLFAYDHLGRHAILPRTRTIDLTRVPAGAPLKPDYRYGYEYSDCRVDDSRLVVLNALDAAERGASIRTRTRLLRAARGEDWTLTFDAQGRSDSATARVLINAAGPWVGQVGETVLRTQGRSPVRLVKGSHIVVRRHFNHDRGYIFQTRDRRVVFALPFARDFTLIGTTDDNFTGDVNAPAPVAEEVDYLCRAVNVYFREPVGAQDVVWSYAGVRSLYDDGSADPEDVTRDYVLTLDELAQQAPLLTIYGGKITTYRRLAEATMAKLSHVFAVAQEGKQDWKSDWTAGSTLPGGDFPHDRLDKIVANACTRWPFLTEPHAARLMQSYGTRIDRVLGSARTLDDLGPCLLADLTAAEVRYLMQHEWARTADDVLWRRSKLGLLADDFARARLADFMAVQKPGHGEAV